MNNEDFERRLKETVDEMVDEYLDSLPDPEECHHTFSPEFERKMQEMINNVGKKSKRRRRRHILRIVFLAVIVLVAGVTVTLALTPGVRATFSQWMQEIIPGWFAQENVNQLPAEVPMGQYTLTWVPEGYVECPDERFESDSQVDIVYRSSENNEAIVFEYMTNKATFIKQRDTMQEEVRVHELPAILYWDESGNNNILCWEDAETGMFFCVSGHLSEAELVRMAENVKNIE